MDRIEAVLGGMKMAREMTLEESAAEIEILRDENERLRAERDEVLALLDDIVRARVGREFPCVATDVEDMVAKLRGAP